MDKKNIVWIASYPKSGNTWFRLFLSNIMNNGDYPVNINSIIGEIASNRELFDEITGVPSSILCKKEILRLRPEVYRYIANKSEKLIFLVHLPIS